MVHYLNSKNEDGLLELEKWRVIHQNELNKVINDSKVRIKHLTDEIISKSKEISNDSVKIRELEMSLGDAKAAGRSELQELKFMFTNKEGQLHSFYKTKIEKIVTDAEECKQSLTESASHYQEEVAILQLSLNESLQRVHDGEVAFSKAKEAYCYEIKQIIRKKDEQYNSLVAEQVHATESSRGQ